MRLCTTTTGVRDKKPPRLRLSPPPPPTKTTGLHDCGATRDKTGWTNGIDGIEWTNGVYEMGLHEPGGWNGDQAIVDCGTERRKRRDQRNGGWVGGGDGGES